MLSFTGHRRPTSTTGISVSTDDVQGDRAQEAAASDAVRQDGSSTPASLAPAAQRLAAVPLSDHTVEEAMDILRQVAPDYMRSIDQAWSYGLDPLIGQQTIDPLEDKCDKMNRWTNPLESTLPVAPDMKIYCLYGVGKNTERAYMYKPNPHFDFKTLHEEDVDCVAEDEPAMNGAAGSNGPAEGSSPRCRQPRTTRVKTDAGNEPVGPPSDVRGEPFDWHIPYIINTSATFSSYLINRGIKLST